MSPEQHAKLMAEWRQELHATNYFADRPVPGFYRSDDFEAAHVRARVMKRLTERGWMLKQIAAIWNIATNTVGGIVTETAFVRVPTKEMQRQRR